MISFEEFLKFIESKLSLLPTTEEMDFWFSKLKIKKSIRKMGLNTSDLKPKKKQDSKKDNGLTNKEIVRFLEKMYRKEFTEFEVIYM